jgi:hypothetical protein
MTIRTPEKEVRPYTIDPTRRVPDILPAKYPGRIGTGITVVAPGPSGGGGLCDIAQLDSDSLNRYLRSKGGRNDLAEDIVKTILGHPVGARGD